MNNYILAIDPSLTQTGMVLLDEKGKIKVKVPITTDRKDGDGRYFDIMHTIKICVMLHSPKILAIESQYFSFNAGTAIKLSKLRGMIIGMYKTLLPQGRVIDIHPNLAKKAVGVNHKQFNVKREQSKELVKKGVLKIYPELEDAEEDILDAVAIGLAAYLQIKKGIKI